MKKNLIVVGMIVLILAIQLASANVNEPTILVDKDEDIEWLNFEKDKV